MKRNILKLGILAGTIIALNTIALGASIGDGTVDNYNGYIKGKRQNTWLGDAYRDTTKKSDPFYVSLEYSDEGSGTVTRFWIEDKKENNLCDTRDVTQGKGFYPQNTYQAGCNKQVYLTAENNNYNQDIYRIEGQWTEE